ncbi:MAG: ribulokinase [Bacillota bacterium]
MSKYVIGLDYGTASGRAVIVDIETGEEVAEAVSKYSRFAEGKYCQPGDNQFRQHPQDYLEVLEEAITGALNKAAEVNQDDVVGIGIDTTGSTICAVDREGQPLSLKKDFTEDPDAMFLLWKDHTAVQEAEEINEIAHNWGGIDYTKYEGGVYSSEWFWAKIVHVLRNNEQVREAAFSWVELCDWLPGVLTGNTDPLTMKRSRCAAGHKAMWHEDWGGLPDEEFLLQIEPMLEGIKDRLYTETYTSDKKAGGLSATWAQKLGLNEGIAVAVGAFDAHMGAVGGGIEENTLTKIMGTSTCDIMVADYNVIDDQLIEGICGQVDGSVIPGMVGLEAGQSAFGDVYGWFKNLLQWPLKGILPEIEGENAEQLMEKLDEKILPELSKQAAKMEIEETGLLALDWLNGRRSPFADQTLTGAIVGLDLGTTAPKIYRALVEATCFGGKAIADQFVKEGVAIEQVIALGGIPHKDPLVMQITADVLNKPVKVAASLQAVARGAAMFAAVAAGEFEEVEAAQEKMAPGFSEIYEPIPENVEKYQKVYDKYDNLGRQLEDYLREV